MLLGLTLVVTTVIGAETALGFAFDPRYRDFPFASLTMAVVPFAALMLVNRPKEGTRPIAEVGLCRTCWWSPRSISAFNEGAQNWQAMWTCAIYFLLARYAVAGAGRANPKISSPIASPDSTIL